MTDTANASTIELVVTIVDQPGPEQRPGKDRLEIDHLLGTVRERHRQRVGRHDFEMCHAMDGMGHIGRGSTAIRRVPAGR